MQKSMSLKCEPSCFTLTHTALRVSGSTDLPPKFWCVSYLTESIYNVVLQKSITAQIRQLIPHDYWWTLRWRICAGIDLCKTAVIIKKRLTDLCGTWLLQNDFINFFWETTSHSRQIKFRCPQNKTFWWKNDTGKRRTRRGRAPVKRILEVIEKNYVDNKLLHDQYINPYLPYDPLLLLLLLKRIGNGVPEAGGGVQGWTKAGRGGRSVLKRCGGRGQLRVSKEGLMWKALAAPAAEEAAVRHTDHELLDHTTYDTMN